MDGLAASGVSVENDPTAVIGRPILLCCTTPFDLLACDAGLGSGR
jgi:hypothetical protein